jgi:hypothetical protein
MAEAGRNAYATTAANAAATTPTVVAVVNDGTGDRQIMIIGDPTTPGNLQGVDSNGRAKVYQADVAVLASPGALNATGAVATSGIGIVGIQVTGTWVGTITFQGTEDPLAATAPTTSWFNVNGVASVTGLQVTTTTANGQWRINAGSYTAVRVLMSVYTSGTATVWLNSSAAASMATLAEPLPVGTNSIGTVQPGNTPNTTPWLVNQQTATVGTITSVAGAATSTTLLASNVNRKGAHLYNESTAILYLGLTASAVSLTSYTVQVAAQGYFELPNTRLYTGQLTGIWAAANGNVRVTELT